MKRYVVWPWILLAVIFMVAAIAAVFQMSHIVLNETLYPWNLNTLTFSAWPVDQPDRLK